MALTSDEIKDAYYADERAKAMKDKVVKIAAVAFAVIVVFGALYLVFSGIGTVREVARNDSLAGQNTTSLDESSAEPLAPPVTPPANNNTNNQTNQTNQNQTNTTNTLFTVTLIANPANITLGQSVTLSWSARNATACTSYGDWVGDRPTFGSDFAIPNSTGTKTFRITCSKNGTSVSANVTVTVIALVDTTPPAMFNGAPGGNLTPTPNPNQTISMSTNENANCRYSPTSGTSFGSMTAFTHTGTLSHNTVVQIVNGQNYSFYVKCSDLVNNTNTTDYVISFSVGTPLPGSLFVNYSYFDWSGSNATAFNVTFNGSVTSLNVYANDVLLQQFQGLYTTYDLNGTYYAEGYDQYNNLVAREPANGTDTFNTTVPTLP